MPVVNEILVKVVPEVQFKKKIIYSCYYFLLFTNTRICSMSNEIASFKYRYCCTWQAVVIYM